MQGKFFLVVNQNGIPVNLGNVQEAVAPGFFLCQFERKPVVSRVVPVQEIAAWLIFDTLEARDAYSQAIGEGIRRQAAAKQPPTPEGSPPPEDPSPKKKARKKKVSKKRSKKSS